MIIIEKIQRLILESQTIEKVIKVNGLNYRTACKIFCIDKNKNILCEIHKPPGVTQLPGGALDIGENHIQAAKRELMEEAGWIAKNFKLINYTKTFHLKNNTAQEWFGKDGWSGEVYSAVKCKAVEYKPDHTFGIEGDSGKFEFIPIREFVKLIKLSKPKYDRIKFRNEFLLEVINGGFLN